MKASNSMKHYGHLWILRRYSWIPIIMSASEQRRCPHRGLKRQTLLPGCSISSRFVFAMLFRASKADSKTSQTNKMPVKRSLESWKRRAGSRLPAEIERYTNLNICLVPYRTCLSVVAPTSEFFKRCGIPSIRGLPFFWNFIDCFLTPKIIAAAPISREACFIPESSHGALKG